MTKVNAFSHFQFQHVSSSEAVVSCMTSRCCLALFLRKCSFKISGSVNYSNDPYQLLICNLIDDSIVPLDYFSY